jgi:hypothetical protein
MCKSFETSVSTFAFSLACVAVSAAMCKTKEVHFASAFILTFSLIQLIDAGIWWSIRRKNNALNRALTRYATPVVLMSELLVSYFGIKYMFGWSNQYFEYGLATFVIGALGTWIFKYCNDANAQHTLPHNDGYLHWCGVAFSTVVRFSFIFFLLFPILVGMPSKYAIMKYAITIPIVTTFVVNFMNPTFGSRWCWSSNVTSALLLVYCFCFRNRV